MKIACYIRCEATFNQLQHVLARGGFFCERFTSEVNLMRSLRRDNFNLILVETTDKSGDEQNIYSWLNCRTGESVPVVMLSANCEVGSIVGALEAGADDYIQMPFDPMILIARLHAVLRRYDRKTTRNVIEVNGFRLNRETGRAYNNGVQVELTPREFTMAWLFFSSPGTYLSRDTISVAIWGVDSEIASRTIEQHIYKLRKKLGLTSERGAWIRTAYTKGYCLQLRSADDAGSEDNGPVEASMSEEAAMEEEMA